MPLSSRIRRRVLRTLPRGIAQLAEDLRHLRRERAEYRSDRLRMHRHATRGESLRDLRSPRNIEAQLTKDYHRVEKGLALSDPARPFGSEVQTRLEHLLPVARATAGRSEEVPAHVVESAEATLAALRSWNEGTDHLRETVSPRRRTDAEFQLEDPEAFFLTRSSVRNFSSREVDDETLRRAVTLASFSPSVCNRQGWLVRFVRRPHTRDLLHFQNGNRGFGEQVPVVGLITFDTRLLTSPEERNQGWIDGGIFAMSLVWALHSLGLNSCMLNMSVVNHTVNQLRCEFEIPDYELVIMMIAVEYAAPGHRVARSARRPLADIMQIGLQTRDGTDKTRS